MSQIDVVRAWKDELYRANLSEAELSGLPQHPAGLIELGHDDLADVVGAYSEDTMACCTTCCCTMPGVCPPLEEKIIRVIITVLFGC
jgi:mersacidin/lichenicidin family type 2 lantibiotic